MHPLWRRAESYPNQQRKPPTKTPLGSQLKGRPRCRWPSYRAQGCALPPCQSPCTARTANRPNHTMQQTKFQTKNSVELFELVTRLRTRLSQCFSQKTRLPIVRHAPGDLTPRAPICSDTLCRVCICMHSPGGIVRCMQSRHPSTRFWTQRIAGCPCSWRGHQSASLCCDCQPSCRIHRCHFMSSKEHILCRTHSWGNDACELCCMSDSSVNLANPAPVGTLYCWCTKPVVGF